MSNQMAEGYSSMKSGSGMPSSGVNRRRLVQGALAAGALAVIARGATTAQDATPIAESATPAIAAAANAFLASLTDAEMQAVLFDWTDTAQKQRWSNLPEGLYQRTGLMWGNLGDQSRAAWQALMQATLSPEGYNRVLAEWVADDALAAEQGGGGPQLQFGTQYYWVAIIGAPSETDPWQWQFGGHHVTINATVGGSNLSLSPSFIGAQPAVYTDANGATVRPLGDIEDDAFSLINLLDSSQQQVAILGDTPIDLVLGPGQDGKTLQPEGLPAAQMSVDQQAAFRQLIGHYAGLGNDEATAARMTQVETGFGETTFVWYGPTTPGSAAYFRVTGPTIVIEHSPQKMGGNAANHTHGIYRDPTDEYGASFTGITITS